MSNIFKNKSFRAKYSKATQSGDSELSRKMAEIEGLVSRKISMSILDTRILLGDDIVDVRGNFIGEWTKEKARIYITNETNRIAKESVGKRSRI